ncbi:MAG: S41 family peptidase [Saprospiraceae bacterium]
MTDQSTPKSHIRLPLLLAIALAVGMFIGQQLPRYENHLWLMPNESRSSNSLGTLDEILRYVEAKYVDSVDTKALQEEAIANVLEQLDPHSLYISPEELEHEEEVLSGNFEGIGIEFLLLDDTIQVVAAMAGGPSEAAGILAGDKIVTIDDSLVAGVHISNAEIFKKLRGSKGSKVRVGVRRGKETRLRQFGITRDVIPVRSVDVAYMLDNQTGYIKINRFSAPTYQEFMEELRRLVEEKGLKNLVLDLRGNPGGYLDEATELLSQVFPEGKLLVYTEGRAEERQDYKSNGRARFHIQNVAVLVDEGSASASEIVAGAIQDHDRGWVIGRRTFGKGLVQVQYPLGDGGALRLTISRYYTPSGRSIQRAYKGESDYSDEAERRLQNGELADATKIRQADSTKYYTGMGRVVFGGGGITPDVFIPLDTSYMNAYFDAAFPSLPAFAARWLEKQNRAKLPASAEVFAQQFNVSDAQFGEFVSYVREQGHEPNERQISNCRAELSLLLKARIAKLLFKEEGQYRVLNDDDPAVGKALQVLNSGNSVAKK